MQGMARLTTGTGTARSRRGASMAGILEGILQGDVFV